MLLPEQMFDTLDGVTERPRIAQREPRSLQPEQMGQLTVCTPAVPQRVRAWVLWEDGVEELVGPTPLPGRSGRSESDSVPTSSA